MANASGNRHASGGGEDRRRRRTKRKRSVLNLGMPFFRVDDFVNQAEDAVALGYRVLVETVETIKKGYKEAQDFHEQQEKYEKDERPDPPAIPWEQLVQRAQSLQTIWLNAVEDGTNIAFDAVRSGTSATQSAARAWEQSRGDVDPRPVLAGPIFDEPIVIEVTQGDKPTDVKREIIHRGLARLRINAIVKPTPRLIDASGSQKQLATLIQVDFEPKPSDNERISVLSINFFGPVTEDQTPGRYEGFITATNFELVIARLLIHVKPRSGPAVDPPSAYHAA
jgi:hypothetical protein